MFYFPLSNLCPHCGQPFENEDSCLVCLDHNYSVDLNDGGDWRPYHAHIAFSKNYIWRIAHRIDDYIILWFVREKQTHILQIDPEYWDGYSNNKEIARFDQLLWFGDWQQPNLIKEKINILLLLQ